MSEEWENALMYNDLEAIREITNKLYEENKQLIKDGDYWINRAYEYKEKLETMKIIANDIKEAGNEIRIWTAGCKKILGLLGDD